MGELTNIVNGGNSHPYVQLQEMRVELETGLVPQEMVAWTGKGGQKPKHPYSMPTMDQIYSEKRKNKNRAYMGTYDLEFNSPLELTIEC